MKHVVIRYEPYPEEQEKQLMIDEEEFAEWAGKPLEQASNDEIGEFVWAGPEREKIPGTILSGRLL